jgi:hypothetical protein
MRRQLTVNHLELKSLADRERPCMESDPNYPHYCRTRKLNQPRRNLRLATTMNSQAFDSDPHLAHSIAQHKAGKAVRRELAKT